MTPVTKKAFVVDLEGKPLLPTHPARARKLLKKGLAVIFTAIPFTIQLKKSIVKPVGQLTLNCNDGTKECNFTVVNEHTQEIVFLGTHKLRQSIKNKLLIRRHEYYQAKRYRKLSYQKEHFDRLKSGCWSGMVRQKKESILQVAKKLRHFMPINHAILEQGKLNNTYTRVLWKNRYTFRCGLKTEVTVYNKRYYIEQRFGGFRLNSSGEIYFELIFDILFTPYSFRVRAANPTQPT